jgi:hypothetical protein
MYNMPKRYAYKYAVTVVNTVRQNSNSKDFYQPIEMKCER